MEDYLPVVREIKDEGVYWVFEEVAEWVVFGLLADVEAEL